MTGELISVFWLLAALFFQASVGLAIFFVVIKIAHVPKRQRKTDQIKAKKSEQMCLSFVPVHGGHATAPTGQIVQVVVHDVPSQNPIDSNVFNI